MERMSRIMLKQMPPFNDWLLCGVSTQLHQEVKDFDILLNGKEGYFPTTGLLKSSIIRLGFLAVLPSAKILGKIGEVPNDIRNLALERLSHHLKP